MSDELIACVCLLLVAAVATGAVLHPDCADTLLQRIGLVLIVFACLACADYAARHPVPDAFSMLATAIAAFAVACALKFFRRGCR
jgi:hypothetical protein